MNSQGRNSYKLCVLKIWIFFLLFFPISFHFVLDSFLIPLGRSYCNVDLYLVGEDFVFTWWMFCWSLSTFWSAYRCSSSAAEQRFLRQRQARVTQSTCRRQSELCHTSRKDHRLPTSARLLWVLIKGTCNLDSCPTVRMQVSLVCTDHRGGVSRTTEDRLNRQNANSPNTGTRSKFRAVAMVARSLGQLSVQSVPSSSEQSMKTGMKYR